VSITIPLLTITDTLKEIKMAKTVPKQVPSKNLFFARSSRITRLFRRKKIPLKRDNRITKFAISRCVRLRFRSNQEFLGFKVKGPKDKSCYNENKASYCM